MLTLPAPPTSVSQFGSEACGGADYRRIHQRYQRFIIAPDKHIAAAADLEGDHPRPLSQQFAVDPHRADPHTA